VHDHARAVERWAAGRGCVSLLDAVQRFPGIQVAALRQAMALLAARGALLPTRGQDAYDVPDRPLLDSDEEGEGEEGADVGARLGALQVDAAPPPPRRRGELLSKAGGIHSAPGSLRTQSTVVHKRGRGGGAGGAEGAGEVDGNVWPTTQTSDQAGGKRVRKASVVERPVYQDGAAPRRAAAAAVAAAPQVQAAAGAGRKMNTRSKAPKVGRMVAMRA
jgi:hypothetical protein